MRSFELSASIPISKEDIRSVAVSNVKGEELVVAGCRDKLVHVYSRPEQSTTAVFAKKSTFDGHSAYVNCVCHLEPWEDDPLGLIVSSGSDCTIQVHEVLDEQPKYVLIGHSANVCSLAVGKNDFGVVVLVSGSWDRSVIVWKNWKKSATLSGHTESVWGIALWAAENTIVTGSADRSIRIWKKESLAVEITDAHSDCVRAIERLGESSFVSGSNDGSIAIWSLEGSQLKRIQGHSSFVYAISSLDKETFASAGEDATVVIWKNGAVHQKIHFPVATIWAVAWGHVSGDLYVGSSDGVIRSFTRNTGLFASPEERKIFKEASQCVAASQNLQSVIQPADRLERPGTKDSQVIVVQLEGENRVYQWSLATNSWEQIGVAQPDGSQPQRHQLDGRYYDHIFPVEIEDSERTFQLPYNNGENEFSAAMNFLIRNNLPLTHLDQISDFIKKNTANQLSERSSFLVFDIPLNLEGINRKLTPKTPIDTSSPTLIPWTLLFSEATQGSLFAVLDLLRYCLLRNDELLNYLLSFSEGECFFRKLFVESFDSLTKVMAIRVLINLFTLKSGVSLLQNYQSQIPRLLQEMQSVPDKHVDSLGMLLFNCKILFPTDLKILEAISKFKSTGSTNRLPL